MGTTYISGNDLSLKLNDITINYDDDGQSEVPVIFIHGFPFDKEMWQHQVAFLSDHYRILAYDIRGFGKSERGLQPFSMDLFADDLIGFMDSLQIKSAVVCGLSMGGYILLNAASRYPARFKAIILSDTQCIADSEEGKTGRKKSIDLINSGGLNEFTEGFIKKLFTEATLSSGHNSVQQIKETILNTAPESITATLAALASRKETCSILSSINKPTLIICGQEDKITTPEQAQKLHAGIGGSTLKIIDKAAHLANLEQPETFNNYLLDFIQKLQ